MTEEDWEQLARLLRVAGGMAIAPDPPIWADAGQVAKGSLRKMLNHWTELPQSHRQYHVIATSSDNLSSDMIEVLLRQPRHRSE